MSKENEVLSRIPRNEKLKEIAREKISSSYHHLHNIAVDVYGHELTASITTFQKDDNNEFVKVKDMIARKIYSTKKLAVDRAISIKRSLGNGEFWIKTRIYKRDKNVNLKLINSFKK